jgi:uncharacterized protein (TIGR02145 family)
MYWNGSAWVRLPAGSNGQILQINGGIPVWADPDFICGGSRIRDIDGNTYNTISIGSQCWTKENLKVTMYKDGTAIPLDATGGSSGTSGVWQGLTTGAYTIYSNEASSGTNATKYGYLYNWFAATDIRGLCPTGWHLPTDAEWTTLTDYLGGLSAAGGKMKSTGTTWNSPNTDATNSSLFSGLPGGSRSWNGTFTGVGTTAFFWSATAFDSSYAFLRRLDGSVGAVHSSYYDKPMGTSIRCLKD